MKQDLSDERVEFNEEVLSQNLDDQIVILDMTTEKYFSLDDVGSRIWELLQEGLGHNENLRILLSEYDVEEEKLRADYRHFIQELKEAGIIS